MIEVVDKEFSYKNREWKKYWFLKETKKTWFNNLMEILDEDDPWGRIYWGLVTHRLKNVASPT